MATTTQTNMPSPDSPNNNMSSKPMKDEDFTAVPGTHTTLGHHAHTLPTSTINHDPFGHPDSKPRTTPSQYATVSDSILGYANKPHDMVLGPSVEKNIKARSVSTEDQAREMIGTGIPSYSLGQKSSLLGTTTKTTTTTTSLTTGLDRSMTHSPTLYDSIATDNPAVAFGEPEDDMAMYEAAKYRASHPWTQKAHAPLDTHLMEMIADTRVNNGGFDEAEDAMAMYEASKYHSLETTRDQQLEKQRDKQNTKRMNQSMMVDPTWINVE